MNPANQAGRFTDSISLSGLFSGESRKPTIILLLTPFLLTTWKYYGTKAFYLSDLASIFVLFADGVSRCGCGGPGLDFLDRLGQGSVVGLWE